MQDDGWCTDLYDRVEEFLGFWAKFYLMKEEKTREEKTREEMGRIGTRGELLMILK